MGIRQLELLDLKLPITLRPGCAVSDELLMKLSSYNNPFRIERTKEGDLIIMTPVGGRGGRNEAYVHTELALWTRKDRRGLDFGSNAGFTLNDGSCLSPDAAWVSLTNWNALTPEQQETFPPLCPEFVIEVRSRSDARRVVEAKMLSWMDNGAQLAWLIDPLAKSVTIFSPGEPVVTLDQPESVTAGGPVAGFELVCGPLWA